jgi:hypothetical protein
MNNMNNMNYNDSYRYRPTDDGRPNMDIENDRSHMERATMKLLRPDDDKVDIPQVKASRSIAPNNIDALLCRDLNQLSLADRDQVTQEIHGVSDVMDETSDPTMVPIALMQLEQELMLLSEDDLVAYRLAHSANPTYTTDPAFRLQFLRANRFHVPTAAQRLARYFQEKLMLFGPEKVGKARITLQDLSEDDKQSLSTGSRQWLPERDRTGRAIYLAIPPLQYSRERSNGVRFGSLLLHGKKEGKRRRGREHRMFWFLFVVTHLHSRTCVCLRPPADSLSLLFWLVLFSTYTTIASSPLVLSQCSRGG